jgi:hypothetical protein
MKAAANQSAKGPETMQGSCLCGAVAFAAEPPLRDVVACHCTQCRKVSGHFWAATSVPLDRFRLTRDDGLVWFRSSPSATRGFCRVCGATLFWKPDGDDRISISPGALDGPTGLTVARHIFTESAGDWYAPSGPPPKPSDAPAILPVSCLCGDVRFTLPRPAGAVTACHCTQCRKLSGHFSASFDADESQVTFQAQDSLAEYVTPGGGRRGFCTRCGSSLYFRAAGGAFSVEAGAADGPTGSTLTAHIFVSDKGDYYALDDGLPQHPGWD